MNDQAPQIEPAAEVAGLTPSVDPETSEGLSHHSAPDPEESGRATETYGSFLIDGMEFALPVGFVQEVVNEPEEVSAIPLSPSYMIGLFNLRGMIVPMIDLREIFGFEPATKTGGRKIAIIEDGEMHLGLVFDATGEVIHARKSERVAFSSREDGIKDVISEGVLKLDNGERILQVLNPYEVLKLERVPRVKKDGQQNGKLAQLGKRKHCISFEVGHSKYGFELEYVQEVIEVPEIKKSFLSHGYVLGSINLRGRIVPIVDFRGFVGKKDVAAKAVYGSASNKLLIMNLLEGQIGLLVYSIDSIIPYYPSDVMPISSLAMPRDAIFQGCLPVDNSDLVMLFDHDETMKQPELIAAAQCCQELYPDGVDQEEKTIGSRQRRTFITFSADTDFAMDITKVREVIERPERLMKPPNAPLSVAGMFNLREEMITLIDLRVLYELEPSQSTSQKVVIFDSEGQKYGIAVDSVKEIIMTTADKVLPFSSNAGHLTDGATSQDVCETVQCGKGDQGHTVMVLDVIALVKHSIAT